MCGRNCDTDVVKRHHAVRRRVKTAKAILNVASGILLALVIITLVGCATAPQSHPVVQFQGSVEEWDQETIDYCNLMAITVVSEAMKATHKEPTPQVINEALMHIYGQCIADNGRTI